MKPRKSVKSTLTLFCLCFISAYLYSAPLRFVPQTIVQPNGEIINCFASGDEFYNYLHDENEYVIIQDPQTGYYVYAVKENDAIVPSVYTVGKYEPSALGLERKIMPSPGEILSKRGEFERSYSPRLKSAAGFSSINNIVIFIRFSDESEFTQNISIYDNQFNASAPSANSMRNYYYEVSYGQLTINSTFYPAPVNSIVVSYQDAQPRSYYKKYSATNTNGYNGDHQRREREFALLKNAVNAVKSQIPAELNVDMDNDGYVDNVCFIIKGSPEGWADLLWPHRWALFGESVYINGKRVYDFNFQLQSALDVGVLCHEMFHTLGAPDLYHYTSNGISPVGSWDIMENDLNPPQHMSAYMKYKYGGWIGSLPEINSSGTYELNPLISSTNNCYKIPSPNSASEYFVVEYRKKEGTFENSLPGSGLLIYRINPAYNGNANGPPDEVYLFRPNGTPTVNGDVNNANFNMNLGRTQINDNANPKSFLTNGSNGGLNINSIGADNATISFNVIIGSQNYITVIKPAAGDKTNANDTLEIKWNSTGAQYVNIEYTTNGGENWSLIGENIPDSSKAYYWIVPHVSSANCLIRVSDTASPYLSGTTNGKFTIFPPPKITINNPQKGEALGIGRTYQITWAPEGDLKFVGISLSTNNGNSWSVIKNSSLASSGKYNWTVPDAASENCLIRIYETSGKAEDTSGVFEIKMLEPLAPVLTQPANNAVNQQFNIMFRWNSSPTAGNYRAQIASDQSFADLIHDDSTLTENSFNYEGLEEGVRYYWRVKAKNSIGWGDYSSVYNFVTVLNKPDSLIAEFLSTNAFLTWIDRSNNEAGFIVERSLNEPVVYSVCDTLPANSVSYSDATIELNKQYIYRVKCFNAQAVSHYIVSNSISTPVEEERKTKPAKYSLSQNYPNPFNPTTTLNYEVASDGLVQLNVYDALGREAAVLVNEVKSPGRYEVKFDASGLPSGVYFYRLQAGDYSKTMKMILAK